MITASALIEKFKYALSNKWGYIYGTAGVIWTSAKQQAKVNYMVKNYGENWKNNADIKNTDNQKEKGYYNAALYGSKWIDHMVADCSGLFAWAFSKLGGAIAHGSNSIYDRYCTKKGKITDAVRKTMLPGTAVFTGDANSHGHIGLYIGVENGTGKVIEASGTQAGVCTSNLSAGKWTYWGELKGVDYSSQDAPEVPSDPVDDKTPTDALPTLKKGMKGEYVTLLQTKLANKGYSLGPCGVDGDFGSATLAAVKAFQKANGLEVDGVVGQRTWEALNRQNEVQYYTVIVNHLTGSQADALIGMYKPGQANKEPEKG